MIFSDILPDHFIFLLSAQKKNETKRKSAGCRSEAKISALFLKKKNENFFTLLH